MEPTSGNTGIALAMIGAAKGYQVKLVMPGCVSVERRRIIEAFGAEVVITPAEEGTDGAIRRAWKLVRGEPGKIFICLTSSQIRRISRPTTRPRVLKYIMNWTEKIDCFVAGMGTTGTLMGVGKYLKEMNPAIRIVGVEPEPGHAIQGLKNMEEAIIPGIYKADFLDREDTDRG